MTKDKSGFNTEKEKEVLKLINRWGGIEEDHHKQWLLDQIVRVLAGDGYGKWVAEYQGGENGRKTYSWDVGTAP